jgi:selT/selW/selH-like putative selenoprotein
LAATIKKELGIDSELQRKSGGIFDVYADGERIYSKYDTGTFPSEKELIEELKKRA